MRGRRSAPAEQHIYRPDINGPAVAYICKQVCKDLWRACSPRSSFVFADILAEEESKSFCKNIALKQSDVQIREATDQSCIKTIITLSKADVAEINWLLGGNVNWQFIKLKGYGGSTRPLCYTLTNAGIAIIVVIALLAAGTVFTKMGYAERRRREIESALAEKESESFLELNNPGGVSKHNVSTGDLMSETKWADIEADEDYDVDGLEGHRLTGFETAPDAQGIKIVTSYTKNRNGQTVKITKRVKEMRVPRRVHKAAKMRDDMSCFKVDKNTEAGITMASQEEILIEQPVSRRNRVNQDDNLDLVYAPTDINLTRATRELKMKFKSLRDDSDGGDVVDYRDMPAKYVPPSRKEGGDRRSFDENTVRVTNLSEDVREKDLVELFSRVGRIHRAYLAKHKETQFSKGFAFITYATRQDALNAINKLNRQGYDNLLLNVEWAKPPNKERQA
ncbi:Eukaryotic translation initiation factor 3 subunit G [Babesia sp. Xinjiang]|uniref:Eukaryotic translation initiation factor 3 subunit G n=1 Tax=Babesia sp. Xinjiang TaxID=462227 RepID=UPI000A226476|nr:Eukaryotic translation initiation factor 3 subunit G [Babesia sp. Xinjiang]ORM39758.1 Eukaryotic translation initiation factor 3 subunit G [Babesia sp. Xinjiang]